MDLESIDLIGRKVHDLLYYNAESNTERHVSSLVITHTGQIMDYIGAETAYIMKEGRIQRSGNPFELLKEIRTNGYGE